MTLFDRDGKPTREFLDSDDYYDEPPLRRVQWPACGPCRVCGRTNERFTIWAERDLCADCGAVIAAEEAA